MLGFKGRDIYFPPPPHSLGEKHNFQNLWNKYDERRKKRSEHFSVIGGKILHFKRGGGK